MTDADPQNYEIDTADLNVTEFELGEPAQALGFVTPFGEAPPDFSGQTLVNFDNIRALLGIGWGVEGTDSPFLSMDASGFVVDIDNPDLGARHFIKVGPRIEDITDFRLADDDRAGDERPEAVCALRRPAARDVPRLRGIPRAGERPAEQHRRPCARSPRAGRSTRLRRR